MKVLHLISSGDFGGAKLHVISLVKKLGEYIDVKLVSFTEGLFAEEARSLGINIEVVSGGSIISDVSRVVSIIRHEHFDIIHSHGAKANLIAAIAKKATKKPALTTVHSDYRLDYMESFLKRHTFGLANSVSLRFLDYYVGVSDSFKQMLIDRGFNKKKVFTVYNGMDFFTEIPEYSNEEFNKKYSKSTIQGYDKSTSIAAPLNIGILARLHPVKDIPTFIRAAKLVLDQIPNVNFLIGGDGDEKNSLMALCNELQISSNVRFLGYIDNPDEFMSIIDINVLTSVSESFPYVILEGARLKKPIVSTDVGGISALVKDGENGFLFKPGQYELLASHILTLTKDECMRKNLGQKIYEAAKNTYSLQNMCKSQLDIYNKIQSMGDIYL